MKTSFHTIALAGLLGWTGFAIAAESPPAPDEHQVRRGKAVFDQWCVSCHGVGSRMAGTASLEVKYGGSIPAALEQRKDMNADFIRYFVRNGVLIMPAFRKTEVSDADLAALSAYLSPKEAPNAR